jgi:DNA-binding transcriptional ArsR family regulator
MLSNAKIQPFTDNLHGYTPQRLNKAIKSFLKAAGRLETLTNPKLLEEYFSIEDWYLNQEPPPFMDDDEPKKFEPHPLLGDRRTISKVAFDILKDNNMMACHETYITIRQGLGYSGMLPVYKIQVFAKNLGKAPGTVRKQLRKLADKGLIEKRKNIWFTVNDRLLTARSGRTKVRKVDVTIAYGNRSNMTTAHYDMQVAEQGQRMLSHKRNGDEDFSKCVEMSISLNAKRIGKSERTVGEQRRRAMRLGLSQYNRNINTVYSGPNPLRFLDECWSPGMFVSNGRVVEESSAIFDSASFNKMKSRRVGTSLVGLAQAIHNPNGNHH